jgi:two-component system NtrC family response regulator
MKERFNILVVEDNKETGEILTETLSQKGYNTFYQEDGEGAFAFFNNNPIDLILLDYKLPGISGEEFFQKVKQINPTIPVIFMTAFSSVEKAVKLLKMGAYSYLTKPIELDELNHNISNALEKVILLEKNRQLQDKLKNQFSFKNFIFSSEKMQEILDLVLRAADSDASILITGESGTGKEVIANIIHQHSRRKEQELIEVNLAALPETLIEAELFGALKGAYTGSIQTRVGKFEKADKGTIFLDEIGELSLNLQVKLLRVLQEREVTKIGSNDPVKVDIRLISSTNQDLQKLIKEGKFREDLFFRLNVINIKLPPLRERKEDIPLLVDLFIKQFQKRENKEIKTISKDALNTLIKYHYPGNIRELENIIERAVVLAQGEVLSEEDLPVFLKEEGTERIESSPTHISVSLPETLNTYEIELIKDALKNNNNNQSKAAKELGISEARLRYRIKTLGIKKVG